MCESFDYKVTKLRRIRVMNIEIGDMKPGDIRMATEEELAELKRRISLSKQ
jgi:23S rRNA pseudouridine2604 synthase